MENLIKTVEDKIKSEEANIKYHEDKVASDSKYHLDSIKKSKDNIEALTTELSQLRAVLPQVPQAHEIGLSHAADALAYLTDGQLAEAKIEIQRQISDTGETTQRKFALAAVNKVIEERLILDAKSETLNEEA